MLFMAWSPVRRTNAGRFEVDHPGDYATFNSYHPTDATLDLNNELSMNDELLSRFSYDGVHLNRDAYAVWRGVIKEYVQRLSLDP
jgi:hypothetical protein